MIGSNKSGGDLSLPLFLFLLLFFLFVTILMLSILIYGYPRIAWIIESIHAHIIPINSFLITTLN